MQVTARELIRDVLALLIVLAAIIFTGAILFGVSDGNLPDWLIVAVGLVVGDHFRGKANGEVSALAARIMEERR